MGGERHPVVELRVHGVGGTPAHDLLGEGGPQSLARVAGDGKDAFYARLKSPRIEGYHWGPLTSARATKVLSLFALPFTLLNASGWALPPRVPSNHKSWTISRLSVAFLGFCLTATYVLGLAAVVVKRAFFEWGLDLSTFCKGDRSCLETLRDRFFYHWGFDGALRSTVAAVWLGALVTLVLMALVGLVSRVRRLPVDVIGPSEIASADNNGVFHTLVTPEQLTDSGFWAKVKYANNFLRAHAVVAFGTLVFVTALALRQAATSGRIVLQLPLALIGLAQAAGLIVLLVSCLVAYGEVPKNPVHGKLRAGRPFILATLAVALTGGVFSLASYLAFKLLGDRVSRPEINLGTPFKFSFAALLLALVYLMFLLMKRSKRVLRKTGLPPIEKETPPGEEPKGMKKPGLALPIARSMSDFGKVIDWPLLAGALVFVAVAGFFLLRTVLTPGGGGSEAAVSADLRAAKAATATSLFASALSAIVWIGGVTGRKLLVLIRKAPKSLDVRRKLGIVWDVLAFFPRRFHPLAVRPYAERAVPAIQGRILHHLKRDRGVILSTHSQGTVLGYAALRQIAQPNNPVVTKSGETLEEPARRIAFVTYGSPLSQLHARFFPALFSWNDYEDLKKRLYEGGEGPDSKWSWRNFFRLTDYIGKSIAPDPMVSPLPAMNEIIPDPSQSPLTINLPLDAEWIGYPDPMRTPWTGLALHSYYNNEEQLRSWLAALRTQMEDNMEPGEESS